VTFETEVVEVRDEDHAREIARSLNEDRRHLSLDQRRKLIRRVVLRDASLRDPKRPDTRLNSPNAIADNLGVSLDTVQRVEADLTENGSLEPAEFVIGKNGKRYRTGQKPGSVTEEVAKPNGSNGKFEPTAVEEAIILVIRAQARLVVALDALPDALSDGESSDAVEAALDRVGKDNVAVSKRLQALTTYLLKLVEDDRRPQVEKRCGRDWEMVLS
jgi:hypothetical protein